MMCILNWDLHYWFNWTTHKLLLGVSIVTCFLAVILKLSYRRITIVASITLFRHVTFLSCMKHQPLSFCPLQRTLCAIHPFQPPVCALVSLYLVTLFTSILCNYLSLLFSPLEQLLPFSLWHLCLFFVHFYYSRGETATVCFVFSEISRYHWSTFVCVFNSEAHREE